MPELQLSEAAQPPLRSRKLTATVIILAILPLVLPLPFAGLATLYIFPLAREALQQCKDFTCQATIDLTSQGWVLILGPSILVAVVSLFFGFLGLARSYGRPTSPKNTTLFRVSVLCGVIWVVILSCVLQFTLTLIYL